MSENRDSDLIKLFACVRIRWKVSLDGAALVEMSLNAQRRGQIRAKPLCIPARILASFAIMGARTHRRVPPPRCGVAGCPTLPPRMNSNSARPISPTRPVRHRDLWALVSILHFLPSPHITLSTAPSVGLTHLCSSIRSCSWYRTGRPGTFRSPHSIGSSSARHRNPHYPTCPTPDTRQQCARTHIWLRPETRHTHRS